MITLRITTRMWTAFSGEWSLELILVHIRSFVTCVKSAACSPAAPIRLHLHTDSVDKLYGIVRYTSNYGNYTLLSEHLAVSRRMLPVNILRWEPDLLFKITIFDFSWLELHFLTALASLLGTKTSSLVTDQLLDSRIHNDVVHDFHYANRPHM